LTATPMSATVSNVHSVSVDTLHRARHTLPQSAIPLLPRRTLLSVLYNVSSDLFAPCTRSLLQCSSVVGVLLCFPPPSNCRYMGSHDHSRTTSTACNVRSDFCTNLTLCASAHPFVTVVCIPSILLSSSSECSLLLCRPSLTVNPQRRMMRCVSHILLNTLRPPNLHLHLLRCANHRFCDCRPPSITGVRMSNFGYIRDSACNKAATRHAETFERVRR
jgi:hypothetical protein